MVTYEAALLMISFLYVLKMIDFRVFNDKSDVKDPEVLGVKSLKVGQELRGFIVKKTSSDLLVR